MTNFSSKTTATHVISKPGEEIAILFIFTSTYRVYALMKMKIHAALKQISAKWILPHITNATLFLLL